MINVAIPVYPGYTALDVVGPYQMLAFTPGIRVHVVAEEPGIVHDDRRSLSLQARALTDLDPPDVVVVPGGPGTSAAVTSGLTTWLRETHTTTQWTTSVCSGSIILGAAGLLEGLRATTHYRHLETLRLFGATPVSQRVVEEPAARVITAAGVSSGVDMGLRLVELLTNRDTAEAVQLWTEYDPQPPFDSGAPHKASLRAQELAADYDLAALAGVQP